MEYFLQQLINGLTLGAMFGLIAIGYTMVYGILGMVNFAHGEIFMIGGVVFVITFLILGYLGLSLVPMAPAGMLLMTMLFTSPHGWAGGRLGYRALRNSNRLAPLISAIGMSIFLQNYVQLLQGARNKALKPIISGGVELMTSASGFTVQLGYMQIVIIGVTTVLMAGFSLLIARTTRARQQRACEQDMKRPRPRSRTADR